MALVIAAMGLWQANLCLTNQQQVDKKLPA
jgi:hypothetical protein